MNEQEQQGINARVLKLLTAIQFHGHGMDRCPYCVGFNVDPQRGETPYKHRKDCELALLMAVLMPSPQEQAP